MSNLSDALDYLRPIAASATVGKYPQHLATVIAAVERLQSDLDAGFAQSDHLSAKYYRRMRVAEWRAENMRRQIEVRSRADRAAMMGEMPDPIETLHRQSGKMRGK